MDNDDFPKGDGDPDAYGYPGEHEPTCYIRVNGGSGKNCDCNYSKWISHENNSNE
jgi:hypothetical protein